MVEGEGEVTAYRNIGFIFVSSGGVKYKRTNGSAVKQYKIPVWRQKCDLMKRGRVAAIVKVGLHNRRRHQAYPSAAHPAELVGERVNLKAADFAPGRVDKGDHRAAHV